MTKLYQVMIEDEYFNLYEIGWFKELKDSLKDLDNFLSAYGDIEITEDILREYASTFGTCFDTELTLVKDEKEAVQKSTDLSVDEVIAYRLAENEEDINEAEYIGVYIRGFVQYLPDEVAEALLRQQEEVHKSEE